MKLLILPSWYPNPMKPDFAPYTRAQAQSLANSGIEVTVVYTAPYSWKWVLPRKKLILGRRIKNEGRLREILYYLPKTHFKPLDQRIRNHLGRRELKRLERLGLSFDAVHVHTYEAASLASWYGRRRGIPIVLTEHCSGFARGIIGNWEMNLAKEAFESVDVRLAVSPPFAKLLKSQTGSHFQVLPNFINTTFFSPSPGYNEEKDYDFLAVGHLLPKKNHRLLVESFARLNPKERGLRMAIIGEGPERRRLNQTLRRLELTDDVHLLGYRGAAGVQNVLRRSRIYCMPSLYETFGIAVIEAMAVGLPAVVTQSGGPETIVEHGVTGLVVAANVGAYSAALEESLNREWDREEIRRRTVKSYSEESVISKLKGIYREAIRKHAKDEPGSSFRLTTAN